MNEDLVARLHARVEERRANGEYPEGLEDQLDEHFRRVVFHRVEPRSGALQTALDHLDSATFDPTDIAADSGMPGGAVLHKAINKAMLRQRQTILDQCSQFADAVREALHLLVDPKQIASLHTHDELVGRIEALVERQDASDRRIAELEKALAAKSRKN